MDITTRNLFRLLRAGVLGTQEAVEPMSAWKWGRAYHLAMVHGVEAEAWAGIRQLEGQFFMRLTDRQRKQWEKSVLDAPKAAETELPPRVEKKLRRMGEDIPQTAYATFNVLRSLVVLSQSLLTADRWVRQLLSLGVLLSGDKLRVDREQLEKWAGQLGMERMLQLEGVLLTHLLGISEERLPFRLTLDEEQRLQMVEEIVATIDATTHQWQFSQGSNIFVHNSSSSAMYWQARHSVRYLKYHPTASISSFFTSFVQSLTNIEE